MDILERTYEIIEEKREELITSLGTLISFPSVAERNESYPPFGEAVDTAYRYMLTEGRKSGFTAFDADGFGGHIDFRGAGNEVLGIVGHLDVVPAGNDWEYDPYTLTREDGKLFGRGTIDDKGPVMACFYAMKALKEAGFKPDKTIRIILGLDEETNWEGMDYYLDHAEAPSMGFTPDGEFPAIHGEMGILVFDIAGKFTKSQGKGLRLSSIKGGNAANMVADSARAVVMADNKTEYEKIKALAATMRDGRGWKINTKTIGKSLEIVIQGKSAHGARPASGQNAISMMMEFLGALVFINEDMNTFIHFYNSCIGYELDGESLGIGFSDEPSGKLILNVGMIEMDRSSVRLTINVRYPVTSGDKEVYDALAKTLAPYNLGVIKGKHQLPIYLPKDSDFIKTLMQVYRKHTGDEQSEPLVIGGGTYARAMEHVVAFGPSMPGDREVAHQKNEYIEEEHLIRVAKLYAETIYELSR